jgi:hypothetical protein
VRIVTTLLSAGACAAIVLVGGCGAGPEGEGDPATTVTVENPPGTVTVERPATAEDPATGAPADDQGSWTMPDLAGATLQDAQDQVQALTGGAVFFTESHDLSGRDRNQVLDANWKVCTQNVAPGAALTAASKVDFGVVKLDEACP